MCCSFGKAGAYLAVFVTVAAGAYVLEQRATVEAAGTQAPRLDRKSVV